MTSLGVERWQFKKLVETCISEGGGSDKLDFKRLRVSGLAHLKVVDFVKAALTGNTEPEKISNKLALTFGIGHAVHGWLQDLITSQRRKVFGNWECSVCHNRILAVDPKECTVCKEERFFIYHEPYLRYVSGGYEIGGHSDLIKIVNGVEPYCAFITDIKTTGDYGFKVFGATGPELSHVVQVMIYMYLFSLYVPVGDERRVDENDMKMLKKIDPKNIFGRIYYINKNDSTELEFGVRIDVKIIDRCVGMLEFYSHCMKELKIPSGYDLVDMNRSIIDLFGKSGLMDCWYAV